MKFIAAILMVFSFNAFSQAAMGPEAVEMFKVLTHDQVQNCLSRVDLNMERVSIMKSVARCPGCNSYTIVGSKGGYSLEKTTIQIRGKAVPGVAGSWIQTYTCNVSKVY